MSEPKYVVHPDGRDDGPVIACNGVIISGLDVLRTIRDTDIAKNVAMWQFDMDPEEGLAAYAGLREKIMRQLLAIDGMTQHE